MTLLRSRLRPLLTWLLIGGVLVAIATVVAARRADRLRRADLLQQTRMVAAAICSDQAAALTGTPADTTTPAYRFYKTHLAQIRQTYHHCRFAYLMARRPDGTIIFLVDGEPDESPDCSPPGQVYAEATPALQKAFANAQAVVEGPVSDQWGTWVSAVAPVPVPDAPWPILLGLDVDVRHWRLVAAAYAAIPTLLAAVAILFGLLAVALIRNRQTLRIRQRDLEASEKRYAELAAQSRTVIWEVDVQGLYTFVSAVVETAWGYRPEDLVGQKHFYDLHPEPGREEFRQTAFAVFARQGAFVDLINPVQGRDGQIHWVLTSGLPLLDAAGNFRGYRGSDLDITARKLAEEARQKSEQILGTLFESMGEMLVLHELVCDESGRAVDYRLTDCNAAFSRITGIRKEEAIGQLATTVYKTPAAPFLDEYARVVRSGTPMQFETWYAPLEKWFLVFAMPLGSNQFATLTADLTARHHAEEQVRQLLAESNRARQALLGILEDHQRAEASFKRLATAIEQSAESIVVTDAQGIIQYVNPAFEAVTGYTRTEAVGQNPRLLKSGQQDAAFYRPMWETLAGGKTWRGRFVNRRKNGTLYTEDAVISPVTDAAGKIVNYVAVKHDITEHLRLETQLRQSQKLESVGRLAGGVAHDFNNMLTVVLGHVGMASERSDLAPEIRSHLEAITQAVQRSADLTRQLLAFARKQPIAPRILDLNQTVTGMLNMLKRLLGENIQLQWQPAPRLWPIRMDLSQLDQILVNLCVNARDAITGVGTIRIATEVVTLTAADCTGQTDAIPGEFVRLTVQDSGCGMDAETLAHIFEPFFTTKQTGTGTGLGLSTVYGIVRQNNGFIDVRSHPGEGTLFHIHLPRHEAPSAAVEAQSAAPILPKGSENLLLVEDDYGILQITLQILEGLGYTVQAANTPEEAIRLAEVQPQRIDLLISDVVMPGMNGRDLARQILDRHPEAKVLFISGYPAEIIARDGILNPGVQFIPKPFSKAALAFKIREVLTG